MDLLCIGDVMLDVRVDTGALARGGDVHGRVLMQPGGTSANAAVWAAWDGAEARVYGGVGTDLSGRLVAEALRERGVKTRLTPIVGADTGTMLVMFERGERSMVADRGANARLSPDDLPGRLVAGAVLVSGYLLLQDDTLDVAVAALDRAVSPLIAVDAASWPLVDRFGVDRFLVATRQAGVIFANEREAASLTGAEGEAAAWLLAEHYPLACVKLGAEGAIVVADGTIHRARAPEIDEVDPTGAGDAFDGVLLGALARGAGIDDALARACRAGSLVASSAQSWPEPDA